MIGGGDCGGFAALGGFRTEPANLPLFAAAVATAAFGAEAAVVAGCAGAVCFCFAALIRLAALVGAPRRVCVAELAVDALVAVPLLLMVVYGTLAAAVTAERGSGVTVARVLAFAATGARVLAFAEAVDLAATGATITGLAAAVPCARGGFRTTPVNFPLLLPLLLFGSLLGAAAG